MGTAAWNSGSGPSAVLRGPAPCPAAGDPPACVPDAGRRPVPPRPSARWSRVSQGRSSRPCGCRRTGNAGAPFWQEIPLQDPHRLYLSRKFARKSIFSIFFFFLSRPHAHQGAWTADLESESHVLYRLNQPGGPASFSHFGFWLNEFKSKISSKRRSLYLFLPSLLIHLLPFAS